MNSRLAAFIKLIRIKNLLVIALTQFFIRFFIIKPEYFNYKNYLDLSLSDLEFVLLVLSTVLVAAAGYIINDYFDVSVDSINRPFKVIVGNHFTRKQAFQLHLILNIAGSILGLLVGWLAGNFKLGFVFFISAGLLWFYARGFKKQFLVGNLLVAILTALVVLLPLLFETGFFKKSGMAMAANTEVLPVVSVYAFFAFLTTLIREIIKDIEDIEGDHEYGGKTLPIVLGVKSAKWTVAFLSIFLCATLLLVQQRLYRSDELFQIAYILIAIQLPVIYLIFNVVPAESAYDFNRLSKLMKLVMLLGIFSMPLFSFFNQ